MVAIKYKNGENEIYNREGHQLHGSLAEGLFGLNPKELLEASLGLCISITLTKILQRDGILAEGAELDIRVTAKKTEGGGNRFTYFQVTFDYPELPPDYQAKLKAQVERGCTISNTLIQGAAIEMVEGAPEGENAFG